MLTYEIRSVFEYSRKGRCTKILSPSFGHRWPSSGLEFPLLQLTSTWWLSSWQGAGETSPQPGHTPASGSDLLSCCQWCPVMGDSGQCYLPWIQMVSHQLQMHLLICSLWLINEVPWMSGLSRSLPFILFRNTFSFRWTMWVKLFLRALTQFPCLLVEKTEGYLSPSQGLRLSMTQALFLYFAPHGNAWVCGDRVGFS